MSGGRWWRLATCLVILALLVPPAFAKRGRAGKGREGGRAKAGQEMVDVIVTFKAQPRAFDDGEIKRQKGKFRHKFRNFRMRSVRIPVSRLERLARNPRVESITLDSHVEGYAYSANRTGRLPKPGSPNFVQTMSDVGVAILDSGVGDHWDLEVLTRLDCTLPGLGGVEIVRDEFNRTSYGNQDGIASWTTDWLESGDGGGPSGGDITVEVDDCPDRSSRCIEFDGDADSDATIERGVDLGGAESAVLSFDYRLDHEDAEFVLEMSSSGSRPWTRLGKYQSPGVFSESLNLPTTLFTSASRFGFG